LISKSGGKKFGALTVKPNKDLDFIKKLIESGKVNPVIDRIYKFKDAAEALRYYGEGHASGKVVINIADEN
jgi:NADPH:quinone reductase-like Zn-dependent oxidoreductase